MYAFEAGMFDANCRALAQAARACGAELRKLPEHAVAIDVRGKSVTFPVASDDRDWELTTPEEAFYAAMLDAEAFASATPDDARPDRATPDEATAKQLHADRDGATERLSILAGMLGGNAALADVLRAGGLTGDTGSRFSR